MNALRRFLRKNWRGLAGAAFLGMGASALMPDIDLWRRCLVAVFIVWGVECLARQEVRDAALRAQEPPHA